MHFNLGVEFLRGATFAILYGFHFSQEYVLCGACSLQWGDNLSHIDIQSQFGWQVLLYIVPLFTMELKCFGLTNVPCSLSGEWPNILHSPTPPRNSLYVSIFTWCHFYYYLGQHSVGCYLPMHFNLPWYHFYDKCSMSSSNLGDTFAMPLHYARRMQGYPHGRNVASSHHITIDTTLARSNI